VTIAAAVAARPDRNRFGDGHGGELIVQILKVA
jgi:hypothetical protein